jgi:hypothetical protein
MKGAGRCLWHCWPSRRAQLRLSSWLALQCFTPPGAPAVLQAAPPVQWMHACCQAFVDAQASCSADDMHRLLLALAALQYRCGALHYRGPGVHGMLARGAARCCAPGRSAATRLAAREAAARGA